MAPSNIAPLENILQNCIENLLLTEQQLRDKGDEHRDEENFDLEKFWKDINVISQKLSFECSKICICFSQYPVPSASETSSLMTSLEQAVLALVSVCYSLPPTYGRCLRANVQYGIVRAIQSTRQLLKIIKDEGGEVMAARYRQSTGIVWQGCEKLEKCPRDNKATVLMELKGQNTLVSDAFNEITEALKGDGSGWSCLGDEEEEMEEEEEEKWSNEDKDLIGPSVNLIKAAKILYKRVIDAVEKNGSSDTCQAIKELDQLHDDCKMVSKIIDTLILELYPPLNIVNMEEQSHHLATLLKTAVKTCAQTHIATEAEQPQLEFIHKAIDHNLDRMKEKLSQR
ncbi:cyclin-D1-binding protein 1 homolog [Penaeus japonicus]|uniref:cyclin-D1-binding protein 1 homolog n=1 Tax=Penaeus japonicus TaxID=27405 RepID=UPI001C70BF4C|nr:cyclin-D1-binding protein 1 homolog [Penaeus japonicus]